MSVEPAVLVMVVEADKAEALTTIQYNATRMIMIMRAAVIISLNFCLCLEAMADNEETRF